MSKTTPKQNKALVLEAFDTLFNKRDYEAAKRYLVGPLHPTQRAYCARPRRSIQPRPYAARHFEIRKPSHPRRRGLRDYAWPVLR